MPKKDRARRRTERRLGEELIAARESVKRLERELGRTQELLRGANAANVRLSQGSMRIRVQRDDDRRYQVTVTVDERMLHEARLEPGHLTNMLGDQIRFQLEKAACRGLVDSWDRITTLAGECPT